MYNGYAGMRAYWSDTTNMDNLRGAAAVLFVSLILLTRNYLTLRFLQGVAGLPTETVIDKDSKSGFGNTVHTFTGDTDVDPPCPTIADLDGKWKGYTDLVSSGGAFQLTAFGVSGTITEGCDGHSDGCGWFTFSVPAFEFVSCMKVSRDAKTFELQFNGQVSEFSKQ
jgi:hypothetical protein